MPTLAHDQLREVGYQLFTAAGCNLKDARVVVDPLVDSSLYGHDSHGAIRLYEYLDFLTDGTFDPRGVPEVVWDRPCTALVDGGSAMGQIGATFATRLAMDKAGQHGVAAVTLRNTGHIGRVGAYPLMVAEDGMIGLVYCNAGRLGRQIAPFGGLDPKMSTNPIAFASPRRGHRPIMVDMATSVTAEGKIRVARNRGTDVPLGWLIDNEGTPTTNPDDFLTKGGAILPLGGVAGYKGYCLSIIVELLGGALSGQGVTSGEQQMVSNGVLITVYDIEHFTDLEDYYDEVETLVGHIRSSRIDPAIGEILLPGEPEFRSEEQRIREGIELDNTTWSHICEAGVRLGLDTEGWHFS